MKQFVFVVHNHQPVGNLSRAFRSAFEHAYAPFLDVLEHHSAIRIGLHTSGPLLDWLEANQPAYLERVRKLVGRGQIEIIGGTLYEAILVGLPRRDQVWQLKAARERLEQLFGRAPTGTWLPERVFEQPLASVLAEAGYEFTFLDDTNFPSETPKVQLPLFVSEDAGQAVTGVPICTELRQNLPFNLPERTLAIALAAAESTGWVIFADDGEKFGEWPSTYDWVYKKQYLEKFFTLVEQSHELETILPTDFLLEHTATERRYLAAAGYEEMLEWSQGNWRNFLARYDESNWMHKRMLMASKTLGDDARDQARQHLARAQCNCAYWHGAFGGLYFPHLRRAVFHEVLEAEAAAGLPENPEARQWDMDCDGREEVALQQKQVKAFFRPALGGILMELDWRGTAHNLLNALSRRLEPYHRKIDASEQPPVDWHPKGCFVDHLLPEKTRPVDFEQAAYSDLGDFAREPFQVAELAANKHSLELHLLREGHVWQNETALPLRVQKHFQLEVKQPVLSCQYTFTNPGQAPLELWFASEFNFCLSDPDGNLTRILWPEGKTARPAQRLARQSVGSVRWVDEQFGVQLELAADPVADVWQFPLLTLAKSEGEFEQEYQATTFVFHWEFVLQPGESWHGSLSLNPQAISGI